MEVNKLSYAPDFQAKIIIGDERIQKFIKSSFMANSKATFETLDRFSEIYPDSIVSIGIKNLKNRDYLVAKNGVTGAQETKLIKSGETLNFEDRTTFIDLIKKIMNKKSFWTGSSKDNNFDATAIESKIPHDVFEIE